MSFFAAWTDEDCYKADPYLVPKEKWVDCKLSQVKLGLLISSVIIVIVVILTMIFLPGFYKLLPPAIGATIIGLQVVNMISVRARASAEHDTSTRVMADLKHDRPNLSETELITEYKIKMANIRGQTIALDAAKVNAAGNVASAAALGLGIASAFRKKEGGDEEIESDAEE